ncbi:MAG: Trk system potassium transporter TrkA [Syntrophomonadaceae bacterium]|jgi:trk system potassium uptake protein TrkA|nr:Trk system potassium transporter TrkA [Syntrophomonadaceae bacterium]
MKTIIIGAGKVGYSIAQLLSSENQEVVVIEQDEERLNIVNDNLDVQVILGSGSSPATLEAAGVRDASMLIAVTEMDELNMIACLLAKQYGVKTTVARVRNTEYLETPIFSPEALLGVDLIINPERVTAEEIAKIVRNPEALSVEYYADGRVQMVEIEIPSDSFLHGTKLRDLDTSSFVIVSIIRQHRTIVPAGNDYLYSGDKVYVMAKTTLMPSVLSYLGIKTKKIDNVTILGAGRTGCYLARILERERWPLNIKMIEKNPWQARKVENMLKNALIINGDGSDLELLRDENIGDTDIFISVTDDDRLNILSSLIAKSLGVKLTICKVKRSDLMPLVDQIGIDVTMSPRMLTAGAILKYIRRGDIVSVTLMGEEMAEMLELVAQAGSVAAGKKLSKIKFPPGSVLGAIVREDQVIIPSGEHEIKANDHLMVFSISKSIPKVEKLFLKPNK